MSMPSFKMGAKLVKPPNVTFGVTSRYLAMTSKKEEKGPCKLSHKNNVNKKNKKK